MKEYSNYDLYLMLGEIKGDVKALVEKTNASILWQKEHEDDNEKRFKNLERLGKAISLVSGTIAAIATYILTLTGKL